MIDPIADVARLEAQLEHSKTIHAPPPDIDEQEHDTGKVSRQTAEDARMMIVVLGIQDQVNQLIAHLSRRADGHAIDISEIQTRSGAFEVRTARGLTALDEKLDKVLGAIETLADGKLQPHQRIVSIEQWRKQRDLEDAQADLIRHQEAL